MPDDSYVGITTYVDSETHQMLRGLAENRGISIRTLCGLILTWSANKTLKDLYQLGVDLPFYVSEIESLFKGEDV